MKEEYEKGAMRMPVAELLIKCLDPYYQNLRELMKADSGNTGMTTAFRSNRNESFSICNPQLLPFDF